MEDKVRIKNLKSLFDFFEKFGRDPLIVTVAIACMHDGDRVVATF